MKAAAPSAPAGPPNVSVLPYPDPVFKGVIGRTTEDSKPDFPQPVSAPEGAPNILLILTDDVGFGASSVVRRPGPDADVRGAGRQWPQIQRVQHDRALLADARGPHHRARPAHGAYRHHHGAQPRLSRLQFADAEERRHGRRNPARQRLQHRLVRQEPQRAGLAEQRRRAVRSLADRARLRLFLRLHRRRREPVGPDPVREHDPDRAQGETHRRGQGELPSRRRSRRSGDPLDRAAAGAGPQQAVLRLLRPGRDPRPAPRAEGLDREVQGPVRSGLGQAARGDVRASEEARRDPAGYDLDAASGQHARLGLARCEAEGALRPHGGNLRRLPRL